MQVDNAGSGMSTYTRKEPTLLNLYLRFFTAQWKDIKDWLEETKE